jgi:AAA15 family ATPase/GTPase
LFSYGFSTLYGKINHSHLKISEKGYFSTVKIEKIEIDNFKSLNNFKIENPNPFSVFVGANGVGKSNIFEALEYLNYRGINRNFKEIDDLFEGYKSFINFNRYAEQMSIKIHPPVGHTFSIEQKPYEPGITNDIVSYGTHRPAISHAGEIFEEWDVQFIGNFSRIFINAKDEMKFNNKGENKLNLDGSNMEQVLRRLLQQNNTREEIYDWLSLFIPAFSRVDVTSRDLSGTATLEFYEKGFEKPFPKRLISDGTRNILCLITAIYQSDEPQFLCIEEPENGLNPYVVKELVGFFREQCREKGHYIWLNTHSQTLVNQLKPEEIIVVNKEDGNTVAKQFQGKDMHGMAMDTAWLSNFFGGGVPW